MIALFTCIFVGCTGRQVVRCPVDDSELRRQILAVAPLGTPREETLRRLKSAGIGGSFGSKGSKIGSNYYCCDTWRRADGPAWRMNVLLQFDKSGALCEVLELPDLILGGSKTKKTRT